MIMVLVTCAKASALFVLLRERYLDGVLSLAALRGRVEMDSKKSDDLVDAYFEKQEKKKVDEEPVILVTALSDEELKVKLREAAHDLVLLLSEKNRREAHSNATAAVEKMLREAIGNGE